MKNKILLSLLLVGSGHIFGQTYDMGEVFLDFLKDCASEFTSDFIEDNFGHSCEKKQRRDLYYAVKGNPYFYKMGDIDGNRDYLTSILRNHIQLLEQKIKDKKPWYKTGSALKGFLCSTVSLCFHFYLYAKVKMMDISVDLASIDDCIALGLFATPSIFLTLVSIGYFNKAMQHNERLVKHLKRDKDILKILENNNL